jgi:hypothetical protein
LNDISEIKYLDLNLENIIVQIKCEDKVEIFELYQKYEYIIYLFPQKYLFYERIQVKCVSSNVKE